MKTLRLCAYLKFVNRPRNGATRPRGTYKKEHLKYNKLKKQII